MSTNKKVYRMVKSSDLHHVAWIDIHGDGTMHECAVMREDPHGNVLFFKVNDLDAIDRRRLAEILHTRGIESMELWEAMANRTLNNGVNALTYFNQLIKVLAPNGQLMEARTGQMGVVAPRTPAPAAPAAPV